MPALDADDDQVEVSILVVVARRWRGTVEFIDPGLDPNLAKSPADGPLRHGVGKRPGRWPSQCLLHPLQVPAQLQRLGMRCHRLLQNRIGAGVVLLPQRGIAAQ